MSRLAFGLVVCLVLLSELAAQLKVDVALVNVIATITDDKGRYAADLSANDLTLEEDGQPQPISHFTQSRDLPVSVGIILDTSNSMAPKIATATLAVERFIRSIHPDDDVFLMSFSSRPVLQQDFTNNRVALGRALASLRVNGETALYDALVEGLRKIKDGAHQRKAVLVISDGDDTTSANSFETAALAVRESEVLVYSLAIAGTGSGPVTDPAGNALEPLALKGRPDAIDVRVLNALSSSSGGKGWLVSGKTENRTAEIQDALDEIASELRNQYSIGYYPAHPSNDGKWHRIQIRANDPRYLVRSRREYFGGSVDCPYLPFFSPCEAVFPGQQPEH